MFAKVIADRYARAVLENCPDIDSIERAKRELNLFRHVYSDDERTRDFLTNPKIPPKIKIAIMLKALGGIFDKPVLHLVLLLIEKRRNEILPDIAIRYGELTDEIRGVEHAIVFTAVGLDDNQREAVRNSIRRFSARKVEVEFRIDQSIIGGVTVRMGDMVIDGSLKKRFGDLRSSMLAVRLTSSVQP
ncbi:MAG: ATP synthase F1 subunit delta [bacterium]